MELASRTLSLRAESDTQRELARIDAESRERVARIQAASNESIAQMQQQMASMRGETKAGEAKARDR